MIKSGGKSYMDSRLGFKSLAFGVLTLMIGAPAVSRATLVFSNFGADDSYNTGFGNQIGDDGLGDNLAEADTFTPASTVDFSSLEIALSCFGGCPDSFTVELTTDVSGLPNTDTGVLESFTESGTSLAAQSSGPAPIMFTSILNPVLTAGTPYWIVVLPDAGGVDQIAWGLNTQSDPSASATAFAGGGPTDTWVNYGDTPGAYEVDGSSTSSVPEPGTLGMLLGGGLLLGLLRKVRLSTR
jgi:PEP-CTERM motif